MQERMGVGFNVGCGQVSSHYQTYISLIFGEQICAIGYPLGEENKSPA